MNYINQNRIIGRVLSVDNFRVFIKIEEHIMGSFKSGVNDIYEVARINSYLIIPVGADRIVALITRVTMKEEVELNSNSASSISLPSTARYISATMLGTIAQRQNKDCFIQGVYSFPSLDNPVWYVTENDLDQIFDNKASSDTIDYRKDFYLPIGTSPAFQNYKVKICPDQFFVKHAAILGNTGSGKSCTLTSILRNLFKFEYNGNTILSNAHIVIFDTNGEYKDAFISEQQNNELERINAYYYGGEGQVKVPYWLMNWDDFKFLLSPGEGVQAPILNRAIGLAKNEQDAIRNKVIPNNLKSDIEGLLNSNSEEIKKKTGTQNYGNWIWKDNNEILGDAIKVFHNELGCEICNLANEDNFNNASKQQPILEKIGELYNAVLMESMSKQITNEQNIDLPIWFSYQELCKKYIDAAINQDSTNNNRIAEYLSTLRLRMNSFLNDKRIAVPLMLKDSEEANKNILPQFLSLILGDFNKVYKSEDDHFINQYNNDIRIADSSRTNQITIVDVSQLPYEVLETFAGLLGRIILEFVANFIPKQRGKYPIVIVLEEAQNYIAENKDSIAKTVFERIAREGRKYGISLIVSSQRPSELSKTVLSQCNSFIIHRLQNPDDQKYVRGLISSANADLLDQLPIIPQQHAIITGDCVRTPIQVRIDDVSPTPNSHNPEFVNNWISINDRINPSQIYDETCKRWIGIDGN